MSESQDTPDPLDPNVLDAPRELQRERMETRAAYVTGLRQLADFVEQHPDLPVPLACDQNTYVYTKQALVAVARTPGVRWQKSVIAEDSKYFQLRVEFAGGHGYAVFTDRAEVCRKVVTGTRIEPAKPEQEVETFHWVCDEPLLAGATS